MNNNVPCRTSCRLFAADEDSVPRRNDELRHTSTKEAAVQFSRSDEISNSIASLRTDQAPDREILYPAWNPDSRWTR